MCKLFPCLVVLVTLGLGTCLGAAGPNHQSGDDLVYQGKTLDQWLKQLRAGSARGKRDALFAVAQFGPKAKAALPAVREYLKDQDGQMRQAAVAALLRIDPTQAPQAVPVVLEMIKNKEIPPLTAWDLLQGAQKEAAPALIKMLDNQDEALRQEAVAFLGHMGKVAVPQLRTALQSPSARARAGAALAFGRMTSFQDVDPAVPELTAALKDQDEAVQLAAVEALQRALRKEAREGLPVLERLLASQEEDHRLRAAYGLGNMPGVAKPALPALLRALKDSSQKVRLAAATAILTIDRDKADAVVPVLLQGLQSRDKKLQRQAAILTALAGARAKAAVPLLVPLVNSKDAGLQQDSLLALGSIGPDARQAAPELAKLLRKVKLSPPDAQELGGGPMRIGSPKTILTAQALGRIGGRESIWATRTMLLVRDDHGSNMPFRGYFATHLEQTAPQLVQLLKDKSAQIRGDAAGALGEALAQRSPVRAKLEEKIGAVDKTVVPALVDLLNDKEIGVRQQAALSLLEIDPREAKQVLPLVLAWRKDASLANPYEARRLFAAAGAEAVPFLLEALKDQEGPIAQDLIESLVAIGGPAVPGVVQALDSKAPKVRAGAAEVLSHLSSKQEAKAAAPQLVKLLQDPEPAVRLQAAVALTRVAPDKAKAALPALEAVLTEGSGEVRIGALQALGRMGRTAQPVVPAILKILKKADPALVLQATETLRQIDPPHAVGAVPALAEILKGKDSFQQTRAMQLLQDIGPEAIEAVPALQALLTSANVSLRLKAARALVRVEPAKAPVVLKVLFAALTDEQKPLSLYTQKEVLRILGGLGAQARSAVPALKQFAEKSPNRLQVDVAQTLIQIGPPGADEGWAIFQRLLQNTDSEDFVEALEALEKLGPKAQPVVPTLIQALKAKSSYPRAEAARALGEIGPGARTAIPELQKLLQDKSTAVRKAAREALKKIAPTSPPGAFLPNPRNYSGNFLSRPAAGRTIGCSWWKDYLTA